VEPKASNRANPIASTLSTVHGYPDRLKIYRIPASEFWWVRATFGERRIKRSTKETDRPKAIKYAKAFYEELLRHNKDAFAWTGAKPEQYGERFIPNA